MLAKLFSDIISNSQNIFLHCLSARKYVLQSAHIGNMDTFVKNIIISADFTSHEWDLSSRIKTKWALNLGDTHRYHPPSSYPGQSWVTVSQEVEDGDIGHGEDQRNHHGEEGDAEEHAEETHPADKQQEHCRRGTQPV